MRVTAILSVAVSLVSLVSCRGESDLALTPSRVATLSLRDLVSGVSTDSAVATVRAGQAPAAGAGPRVNQQLFRLEVPNTARITPIATTIGYRDARSDRSIGYVGADVGWHAVEERSPALAAAGDVRQGHVGYHVVGGAEYRVNSSLWLAGEVQWTTVPDALGQVGIGQTFGETDLGGTTFRVKVFIGR